MRMLSIPSDQWYVNHIRQDMIFCKELVCSKNYRLQDNPDYISSLTVYYTPAEVYGVAAGNPVALRAPSVPTASTYGDVSTLQTPSFCLENGWGII